MTTNLIATITTVLVTNWTTVSTTIPEPCPMIGCCVDHGGPVLNQEGKVLQQKLATFVFEGQTNSAAVHSLVLSNVTRSISARALNGSWPRGL
jgi:hypothetical protein